MQEAIGNYHIQKVISDKGSYRVCLAIHRKLGRKTLLKIYSGADSKLIERFEREARIVADLDHEAIVSIYDFGESGSNFYIAMEFVDGSNLKEFLERNRLNDAEIISLSDKIAHSLSVLHQKGYIHRDLKPENILIDSNGKVKITDFGITIQESLNRMTQDGELFGTPLYMSPEQINNLPLTTSSDIFTLGIIFYQMTTGIHPFQADRYGEILSNILTHHPEPVRNSRHSIPAWYSDLIQKMLQKDHESRITTAEQIVQIIKDKKEPRPEIEKPASGKQNSLKEKKSFLVPLLLLAPAIILASILYVMKTDGPDSGVMHFSFTGDVLTAMDSIRKVSAIYNETEEQNPGQAVSLQSDSASSEDGNLSGPLTGSYSAVAENQTTSILVKSWPWSKVYLNYQPLDVTPMTAPRNVDPGTYLLSLQNPDFPVWSDSIIIKANKQNEFFFNLDSLFYFLNLEVIPWGEVYIDGKYIGTTPLSRPIHLSRKQHRIEIRNKFYESWSDTLYWSGQDTLKKYVVLVENQNRDKKQQ